MTSVEFRTHFKSRNRGNADVSYQWQMNGSDYRQPLTDWSRSDGAETRFSAWTPVTNKACNQQLFQERTTLVLHWFDLWTDRQRKEFICQLLRRCSKTQLKFTNDCLAQSVPISRMDFTAVLPRLLSLYIMSFLSPRDICAAAQVCWHWKFLAEQDCLWSPKCIRLGWFLPYSPSDYEYGAWKRHYVACAASLDILTPREAADVYGTLNESLTAPQEQEDRWREHKIRQTIRENLAEHKKAALKTRRAWLNASKLGTSFTGTIHKPLSLTAALVHLGEKCRLKNSLSSVEIRKPRLDLSMKSTLDSTSLLKTTSSLFNRPVMSSYYPLPHFLLVSSKVPGYELLLAAVQVSVLVLPYDSQGMTLEVLFSLAERVIQGRMLQSVGILVPGSTDDIMLTDELRITEKTVLKPCVREFWEKLCGWVVPASEGGSLNIFAPLAASVAGMGLLRKLSTLTGLNVKAPTGICTGSYQHIVSEWCGSGEFPPLLYLHEPVLLTWCRQAEWIEEACKDLRKQLEPQLHFMCQEIRGRILGQFLWDRIKMPVFSFKSEVMECLVHGLVALMNEAPCREMLPVFRNFLKRYDRTIATRMLSLQELLLTPSARVEEYVALLQALTLHTPPEHPDYTQLTSALDTLMTYRGFIHKLKKSLDRDLRMVEVQNTIQSCPNLLEGSRYLISTQDVALLNCLNGDIAASLRMYEHVSDVGLFLFNDALVLTERSVSSMPFCVAVNTTHTFLASVALHCLNLTEITDTKYVQNAFQLQSPKRQWICATDREEEKIRLLSALRSAINAAITRN
ncbi:epithelial cell-transforming sequence 2 oncogene-like isoform X5 [Danio rerio]|uniref:Epithelial cell-transforming sequence 2 oncogene-like isoform X5 n=1 Tax=Danio rerio TaxID=7955 RepID=A0AC58HPI2_DANRE